MAAVNESDSSLAKKCFGMTKTSQMSPWPVRMVSRWRHTRWSWQLLVRSSLLCLVYAPRHQEDSPLLLKVAFAAESYSPLPPRKSSALSLTPQLALYLLLEEVALLLKLGKYLLSPGRWTLIKLPFPQPRVPTSHLHRFVQVCLSLAFGELETHVLATQKNLFNPCFI